MSRDLTLTITITLKQVEHLPISEARALGLIRLAIERAFSSGSVISVVRQ